MALSEQERFKEWIRQDLENLILHMKDNYKSVFAENTLVRSNILNTIKELIDAKDD